MTRVLSSRPPLTPRPGAASLALALALLLSAASPALADPPTSPAPPPTPTGGRLECRPLGPRETLRIDASELPLSDLVRVVSCALSRNILLSPPTLAQRSIALFGPRPLSRGDLLTLWHAALDAHRLIEERRGALYLVRPMRAQGVP